MVIDGVQSLPLPSGCGWVRSTYFLDSEGGGLTVMVENRYMDRAGPHLFADSPRFAYTLRQKSVEASKAQGGGMDILYRVIVKHGAFVVFDGERRLMDDNGDATPFLDEMRTALDTYVAVMCMAAWCAAFALRAEVSRRVDIETRFAELAGWKEKHT